MDINFNNGPKYDHIGTDAMDAFSQGRDDGRKEALYRNSQAVYKQAAAGDPQAALTAANSAGNFDAASHITQMTAAQRALLTDKLSHAASVAYGLRDIKDPAQRAQVYASSRNALKGYGWSDADLDDVDLSDQGLSGLITQGQTLTEQLKQQADLRDFNYKVQHDGQVRTDALNKPLMAQDGAVLTRNATGGYDPIYTPGTKPLQQVITDPVTGEVRYVSVPGQPGQTMSPGSSYGGAVPPAPYQGGTITPEQLYYGAIRPMESGGRPGVIGPDTKYGNAQGSSQMLPATAKAVAGHLGIEWRPDLMTAKTPEGLAYQDKLGVGYAQEALQNNGGDPRSALAYYQGGPNKAIHGKNNRAYVENGMVRLRGSTGATGAPQSGGTSSPGNGIQVTSLGGSGDPVWSAAEQNGLRGQVNRRTGEFKADPGQNQGNAGGKPLSEKDIAAARTKLAQARRLKAQVLQMQDLDPDGSKLSGGKVNPNRSGIWGGYVQGRVAGGLAGGDTDAYDTLLSNVSATVGAITRIPGIGSQSDYEARLAAATMPSRTRSASGRAQAYREIWQIAKDMETELSDQVQGNLGRASRGVSNSQATTAPTNDRAAQLRNKYGLK